MKKDGRTCVEVMTKDPLCCQPGTSAARAAQVMKVLDVGPIPVVENAETKKLVGLVTDRDLAMKVVAEERHPVTVKIEEVMTRDVVTCSADDELDKAMQLMAKNQLRRIPVIDNEGAIIGIIAQADIATKATAAAKTGKVVEEISRPRAANSRTAMV